jgi:predicted Zn-dependent protease
MRCQLLPFSLALVMLLTACVATGPGGKRPLVLIPTSQEVALGAAMAGQLAETETALPDAQWQAYLNEVGQKIVSVCDRKDIKYQFTVIQSDQINAFAAPGGYVYFYTGLLRLMDDEAELAAVMAHEVSHVVARHGAKRMQAAMGVSLAYELVLGDNDSKVFDAAVGIGMGLMFAGYSRSAEREADDYGLTYMIRAGYDPAGMITMFDKLAAAGSPSNGFEKLLSSHPESQERINNTRAAISSLPDLPADLSRGKARYQQMLKRLPAQTGD